MSKTISATKMLLLAATCLSAAPAYAQDADVNARLDRLEALVNGLVQRLDAQEQSVSQEDVETARQAQQAIQETRALAQRTEQVEKLVSSSSADAGDGFKVGKTRVKYSGYVKMDAITQKTSGGQVASGSIVRDFLIPGAIPVGGAPSGFDTDFSARQSRFILETSTDVGGEHKIGSKIELDFMVTGGGDERVSNSYVPRLRQAYLTYDNWLFGQAWSTFQDVGALPEALDFVGPTPGTVFNRQPLIRYSTGSFQIAVEQPETTVTTPGGGRVITGDDSIPDMVVRYNHKGDFGHITGAAIGRVLRVKPDDFSLISDSAFAYGVSLSGKFKAGAKDDVRFMTTYGKGLGRYIGLNIVNDAAIRANGSLDPISTFSGFIAFRHFWSDDLRSTLSGSYFKADNPVALTSGAVTDESWNAFGNIIWSPVAPLDLGIEYMYANRALENGASGNLQKLQLSAKYKF